MNLCIPIAFCLSITWANAAENPSLAYIETYKNIAIAEMERTGIPASIKLAQALLESGAGTSSLATKANNHFGIKCNGGWEGEGYYHEDDDYDAKGKLMKSCFRKFGSVSESFYAHSEFLAQQNRYAFLFEYSNKDYYAWAQGLRKAGYATDKKYPEKLINLIEKYQLYKYDDAASDMQEPILASAPTPVQLEAAFIPEEPAKEATTTRRKKTSRSKSSRKSKTRKGFFSKRKRSKNSQESPSEMVFHIVQEGQTLAEIAMIHQLNETSMRLRNRIPKDAEPLAGERVYLRKKISILSRPEFTRVPDRKAVAEEYIF